MSKYQAVRRIVEKWSNCAFESRYARLLLSMSRDQAKEILGFPPSYNPSEEEIKKNYKLRAIQNHPDRGGSTEKMVEINVAKDILTGKAKERWEPVRNSPPPQPAPQKREPPKRPTAEYVVKGYPFYAAWSKAGVPSGTDWKFVSERISLYTKGFPLQPGCVLYGQTSTNHVVCAAFKQESTANIWPPTDEENRVFEVDEGWRVRVLKAPLSKDASKVASKLIKLAVSDFPPASPSTSPSNGSPPRKYFLWPANSGDPTEGYLSKIPYHGRYSLKEVLVLSGAVTMDAAQAAKTPAIIDFYGKQNQEKYRANPRGPLGSSGDFFLIVDGREVKLDDATTDKLLRSLFLVVALSKFDYDKVYRLNKLKPGRGFKGGAYYAFKTLLECLTSEPSWVREALERNVELFKPVEKESSALLDLCSDMSLRQASVTTGIPMRHLIEML